MTAEDHVDVPSSAPGSRASGPRYHLQSECPDRSYAILEARDAIGGTWDLFRYPGIRSDSDMLTLGYSFRPWTRGEGDRRRAVDPRLRPRDRAASTGSTDKIRFGHRVVGADWSTADARWTLDIERARRRARSR